MTNPGGSVLADDAAALEALPPKFEGEWRLHPRVALRPEPFGALAYHYGNRRLNFLRSHDLVSVVKGLKQHGSVDAALDANSIPEDRRPAFRRALAALAQSDFLQPAEASSTDPHSDRTSDSREGA